MIRVFGFHIGGEDIKICGGILLIFGVFEKVILNFNWTPGND